MCLTSSILNAAAVPLLEVVRRRVQQSGSHVRTNTIAVSREWRRSETRLRKSWPSPSLPHDWKTSTPTVRDERLWRHLYMECI